MNSITGMSKTVTTSFDGKFKTLSIVFLVICAIILFLPLLFTQCSGVDFTDTGQIGDTIGGTTAPFIAMAAAYLTFVAFWVQFKANQYQRDDIALERFNTNFFNLLNIHEEITNNLEFEYFTNGGVNAIMGRKAFRFSFKEVVAKTPDNMEYKNFSAMLHERGIQEYINSAFPTYFDHYFRCMYRIVKLVDETEVLADKDENKELLKRKEYVSILRSKLSRYELVWLFYNGLTYGKDKFKPLIEKYALLKNLRQDLLVSKRDIKLYSPSAYGGLQ